MQAITKSTTGNMQANSLLHTAKAQVFEWGSDVTSLGPPFDLVLASDVVYEAAAVPALLQSLSDLAGPTTAIWFAFEDRPPVTHEALLLLPKYGLIASEVNSFSHSQPPSLICLLRLALI